MIRLIVIFLAASVAGCAHHRPTETKAPVAQKVIPNDPYNRPLTSLGTLFGTLPPAAQNTVRAQVGSAEIVNVVKGATSDFVYFKVYFRESDHYPPLYVAADGSLLNSDLSIRLAAPRDGGDLNSSTTTQITVAEIPPAISKLIRNRMPNAEVAQVKKEIWGNHIVYIVSFKDEAQNPVLYLPADAAR